MGVTSTEMMGALAVYVGEGLYHGETDELGPRPGHIPDGLSGTASDMALNTDFPPSYADRIADECGVMQLIRDTGGKVDQPTWFHGIQLLNKCEDGRVFAHEWSKGDPRYREAEVDSILGRVKDHGPTSCSKFAELQPAICGACPHKISGPIWLGVEPSAEVVVMATAKADPFGAAEHEPTAGWPSPAPLGQELLPVPPFEDRFLAGPIAGMARNYAMSVPVCLDFVGVNLLAACGSVISGKVSLALKRNSPWEEPPNAWALNIGSVSSYKTPALRPAREGLSKVEERYRLDHQLEMATFQAQQMLYDAHLKAYKAALGNPAAGAVPALPVPPDEPKARRAYTSNATPEALGVLCQRGPMLVIDDEISGWFSTMADPRNQAARAFALMSWSGGPFRVDRITREAVFVPSLTVTMLGNIQPGLLHSQIVKAAREGSHADGMLQRFVMMAYPDVIPHADLIDRKFDKHAWATGQDAILALASYDPVAHGAIQDPSGGDRPHFTLDEDAYAVFQAWYRWHLGESRNEDLLEAYRQHILKLPKAIATVALLIHVMEAFQGPITGPTMQRAVDACHYFAAHARRVYYMAAQDVHMEPAKLLARRISTGSAPTEFTSREAQRAGWAGCDTPEGASRVLALLQEAGWVRQVPHAPGARGGRPPSPRWQVNPVGRGAAWT